MSDETTTQDATDEALRGWARGLLPLEAATEMLIRGGFGQPWRRWMKRDEDNGDRLWIDFGSIPELIGGMSGGQRRYLMIAASLGSSGDEVVRVALEDEIPGLDRAHLQLVLAAIAHAGGATASGRTIEIIDNEPRIVATEPLYAWPRVASPKSSLR